MCSTTARVSIRKCQFPKVYVVFYGHATETLYKSRPHEKCFMNVISNSIANSMYVRIKCIPATKPARIKISACEISRNNNTKSDARPKELKLRWNSSINHHGMVIEPTGLRHRWVLDTNSIRERRRYWVSHILQRKWYQNLRIVSTNLKGKSFMASRICYSMF